MKRTCSITYQRVFGTSSTWDPVETARRSDLQVADVRFLSCASFHLNPDTDPCRENKCTCKTHCHGIDPQTGPRRRSLDSGLRRFQHVSTRAADVVTAVVAVAFRRWAAEFALPVGGAGWIAICAGANWLGRGATERHQFAGGIVKYLKHRVDRVVNCSSLSEKRKSGSKWRQLASNSPI